MELEDKYFEQTVKLSHHIKELQKTVSSLNFKNGELSSELDELKYNHQKYLDKNLKDLNKIKETIKEGIKSEYSKDDYVGDLIKKISGLKFKNERLKRKIVEKHFIKY